jgi:hypothetical protein
MSITYGERESGDRLNLDLRVVGEHLCDGSEFLFQMADLQAYPLTVFIGGVNGRVFSPRRFLLKCLEMDQPQSIGLRHPDGIALRVFVEQAERSCSCEIAGHGRLQFRPILPVRGLAVSDGGHVKM